MLAIRVVFGYAILLLSFLVICYCGEFLDIIRIIARYIRSK